MKKVKSLLFVALSLALFASCSSDDDNDNDNNLEAGETLVELSIKTTLDTSESNSLTLEAFQINMSEIEFEVSDDSPLKLPGDASSFTDAKLEGPIALNLVSDKASEGIVLATTKVPNAKYKQIEFDLTPYEKEAEEFETLNDLTLYAKGKFVLNEEMTIHFIIESDKKLEVDSKYTDKFNLNGASTKVMIDLNLDNLINELMGALAPMMLQEELPEMLLINKETMPEILTVFEEAFVEEFSIVEVK